MALVVAAPAQAAPDRSFNLQPGVQSAWDGPAQPAANQNYKSATGEPCGKDPDTYCDTTLLNAGSLDDAFYKTHTGTLQVDAGNFTVPANDFDLYVYRSDAAGTRGALVATSGNPPGLDETASIPNPTGYYLVQVVYFATTGGYHGTAKLTTKEGGAPPNPDIDVPPGLQEALASDPAAGFRSHSEPHIAQSPTNPNILVAGSKFYNRDPNSLKQYEFKIGTYVSFDRGRTWSELGQIDTCPASQAPPASWPDNTCYPADDPNVGGTGPEDKGDSRGTTDYGEEYIVSDIWIDFDDEGNAYAMVLDSPPFADGAGWGMSFHKWVTPSIDDVKAGQTWGRKVVINDYPQEQGNTGPTDNGGNAAGFLDDKNTFAVNNAGKDGDGTTGTILACWGQNISTAIKQQTVCKRSTDAGKSFPGQPIPVSGQQQLVLGVATVADRKDPNTFYVYWKGYETSIGTGAVFGTIGDPGKENDDLGQGLGEKTVLLYGVKTTDGGQTFTPPVAITSYNDLPSPLPGTQFRTGSIPQATQAPDGTIYIVFDAYDNAPKPGDSDGKTADIQMVKSSDGITFGRPVIVNQDAGNGDQFQGTVAVAPDGQVNVGYFDRRLDPNNVFVDSFLSQSSDGGKTFKDTRLSHDSSDTSINPPISPSGQFFGDYQGLVADACQTLFFYNDTHLANDASRDPDFDQGLPRSEFQQAQASRLPRPGRESDPACGAPPNSTAPIGPGSRTARPAVKCAVASGFSLVRARRRGRGLRLDVRPRPAQTVSTDIFQTSRGRTPVGFRRVAHFRRRASFTWNGKATIRHRRVTDGYYVVIVRNGRDTRRMVFERRHGRFLARSTYNARLDCSTFAFVRLPSPVFGGRKFVPLRITYALRRTAAVSFVLRRGRTTLRTTAFKTVRAGRVQHVTIGSRRLRRAGYSVELRLRRPGEELSRRVAAQRL